MQPQIRDPNSSTTAQNLARAWFDSHSPARLGCCAEQVFHVGTGTFGPSHRRGVSTTTASVAGESSPGKCAASVRATLGSATSYLTRYLPTTY